MVTTEADGTLWRVDVPATGEAEAGAVVVVVVVARTVVVVAVVGAGAPALVARTALGRNRGAWVLPNVQASTLPGWG